MDRRRSVVVIAVVLAVVGAGVAALALRGSSPHRTPAAAAGTISQTPILTPTPTSRIGSAATSPTGPTATPGHTTSPPSPPQGPAVAPAGSRLVTFVNAMSETIWVAASQNPKHPLTPTGWVLPAGGTLRITVPDGWNGRFWGRTGCVFTGDQGHCETGDCAGRFQCQGDGSIPATLAEYDMNAWQNMDFYDVSLVDGANLPMYINITKGPTKDKISQNGCIPAGCTHNVLDSCPSAMQLKDSAGKEIACETACAAFGGDAYCCHGVWSGRDACQPAKWPVDYAAIFKKAEPFAYSYAFDDATSTYTCSGECDYRITFGVTPGA